MRRLKREKLVNRMNRRIILQRKTASKDAGGRPSQTWTTTMTLWAGRNPLRTREFFAAAAVNAENTVKYYIRYRQGIKTDMRLIDLNEDREYEVVGVLDDVYGDRTETMIIAKEVVAGG